MIIREPLLNFLKHLSVQNSKPADYFEKNLGTLDAFQFCLYHSEFNLSPDDKTIVAIAAIKKRNFPLFQEAIRSGGLTSNPSMNINLSFLQQHYDKSCFSSAAKIEAFLSCGGLLSQRYSVNRKIKGSQGDSHYAFNAPGETFDLIECMMGIKISSINPDIIIDAFENEWITAKVPSHISRLFFSKIFDRLLDVELLESKELTFAMTAERLERIRQLHPLPEFTVSEIVKSSQPLMRHFFKKQTHKIPFLSELLPVLNAEHQRQKNNKEYSSARELFKHDDDRPTLSLEQEECLLFVLNHFWGDSSQPSPSPSSWEVLYNKEFIRQFNNHYDFSGITSLLITSCLLRQEDIMGLEGLSDFLNSELLFNHGFAGLNTLNYMHVLQGPEETIPQFFIRVLTHPLVTPSGARNFINVLNQPPASESQVLSKISFNLPLFKHYQSECIRVCSENRHPTIMRGIQLGLSTTNDPEHLFSVLNHQIIQKNVRSVSKPSEPSPVFRF